MMTNKIHYVYKITFLCGDLKNHYYIGKHSTNNIDDGYHGSGVVPFRYFEQYEPIEGETYIKEILAFTNNDQNAYMLETFFIDDLPETDPLCTNKMWYGYPRLRKIHDKCLELIEKSNQNREYIETEHRTYLNHKVERTSAKKKEHTLANKKRAKLKSELDLISKEIEMYKEEKVLNRAKLNDIKENIKAIREELDLLKEKHDEYKEEIKMCNSMIRLKEKKYINTLNLLNTCT